MVLQGAWRWDLYPSFFFELDCHTTFGVATVRTLGSPPSAIDFIEILYLLCSDRSVFDSQRPILVLFRTDPNDPTHQCGTALAARNFERHRSGSLTPTSSKIWRLWKPAVRTITKKRLIDGPSLTQIKKISANTQSSQSRFASDYKLFFQNLEMHAPQIITLLSPTPVAVTPTEGKRR
jgi:hypothetical protein